MNGNYSIGDYVLGNWQLVELIGEGSFGKVYKAVREEYGNTYISAVKIITVPQSRSEIDSALSESSDARSVSLYFSEVVKEIVQEVALMARLNSSPNVVNYFDHTVIAHDNQIGWDIIIRMELLTPLLTYIRTNPLSQKDVIKLGTDICSALELCERNQIVHRDIKPENIFVNDNGDFKLGDFGIARTIERTSGGLSKKGTYSYMAPEVYMEKPYGSNVDLYSLGIVMYRFLNNNRLPFLPPAPETITFKSRETSLANRMKGLPLPPPCNADNVLSGIILKACAFDPKDRFASAAEMRLALQKRDAADAKQSEEIPSEQTVIPDNFHKHDHTSAKTDTGTTSRGKSISAGEEPCPACGKVEPRRKVPKLLPITAAAVVILCAVFAIRAVGTKADTKVLPEASGPPLSSPAVTVTSAPSPAPTAAPTAKPTATPVKETAAPTPVPTVEPTAAPVSLVASGKCGADVSWTLDSIGTLTLSGTGAMENYDLSVEQNAPWYEYSPDIKKIIINDRITSIGEHAFLALGKVTEILIPESIKTIGLSAFGGCDGLSDIKIPQGVVAIGGSAFSCCEKLQNVTLPDGLKEIGAGTFYNCNNLNSIVIPESVTKIGSFAFERCTALSHVDIPYNVTEIGERAFYECSSLKSVNIPNPNAIIVNGAFDETVSITREKSTIKISTPEQFNSIRFDLNGSYELVADIEFDASSPFEPIGSGGFQNYSWNSDGGFSGRLNGNGYTLSGIVISSPQQCAGLFSSITDTGVVENLNVSASFSSAGYDINNAIGAIAGYNAGTIKNCNVSSSYGETMGTYAMIGGISGANGGHIRDCGFSGTLYGTGDYVKIAGICGLNIYGTVSGCSSDFISNDGVISDIVCASNDNGTIN